jgi:glutamate receptor ionotropic, NMDA 2B
LSTAATLCHFAGARIFFTQNNKQSHQNFFLRNFLFLNLMFLQIGVWKSWEKDGLDIKDIVWPGNSHTPPQGVPEKFHLKITFLEEQPYISLTPPDPVTGKCSMNRGVLCRVGTDPELATVG